MDGARQRLRREQDAEMSQAWHVAYLSRVNPKDFPPLKSMLAPQKANKSSPEEMTSKLDMFYLALGGDPDTLGKIRKARET